MSGRSFFFIAFILAILSGYFLGSRLPTNAQAPKFLSNIHPEKTFATTVYKPFAVVLYAHNDADWCTKALRSVFEQEYERIRLFFIDDASSDTTFAIAQNFILENQQQHRVILMRNEEPLGYRASLERVALQCGHD